MGRIFWMWRPFVGVGDDSEFHYWIVGSVCPKMVMRCFECLEYVVRGYKILM